MTYQLILWAAVFVITFLMHKPFNVHASQKKRVWRIHYILETFFTVQTVILINKGLKALP
ncbi:MAG: hypothetical protein IJ752_04815 [Alphaproteobacteria bacterium]|nr:hypothetical protein [Alphaproteobacteria bacterium]